MNNLLGFYTEPRVAGSRPRTAKPPRMPLSSLTARLPRFGGPVALPRAHVSPAVRRRTILIALVVLAVLVGVYLVLRLTGLTTVERVTVTGQQGPAASTIRQRLTRAATGQSTLGFDRGALERAVARDRSVVSVDAETRFPHGVRITVHQRRAIAVLDVGGRPTSVAADGTLLPDWAASGLPAITGAHEADGRLAPGSGAAVAVLAGAPGELLEHIERLDRDLVVRLKSGPALLFRDTHRVRAKWAAAVAVLTDPHTAGATWIDLRDPEHPTAGRGAPAALPSPHAAAPDLGSTAGDGLAELEGAAPPGASTTPGGPSPGPEAAAPAASDVSP